MIKVMYNHSNFNKLYFLYGLRQLDLLTFIIKVYNFIVNTYLIILRRRIKCINPIQMNELTPVSYLSPKDSFFKFQITYRSKNFFNYVLNTTWKQRPSYNFFYNIFWECHVRDLYVTYISIIYTHIYRYTHSIYIKDEY